MSLFGPSTILSPDQLGPELASIVRDHSREIKLAMFTAAHRGIREVVLEIDNTPAVLRRTRGKSRGRALPAPVDQGELKRSGVVERLSGGDVAIEFTAPHAAHMEFGTRPHVAPIAPLKAWAKRKGRGSGAAPRPKRGRRRARRASTVPRPQTRSNSGVRSLRSGGGTRSGASSIRTSAAQARSRRRVLRKKRFDQLARAAQASIRKHGTEGRHFYARASQKFPLILDEELRKRLSRIK